MYRYLSSIGHGLSSISHGRGSSLLSFFVPKSSLPQSYVALRSLTSHFLSGSPQNQEHVRGFSSANWGWQGRSPNENVNTNASPEFMRDRENMISRSENNAEAGRNSRPMDFVRGIIEDDGKDFMGGSPFGQVHYEKDADFVHIKMLRNNTFVTVTDSKGNVKLSGSAGSLKDLKAGQKLSRYAAEATAEVIGRKARGLGLKSVVMKVKGFTHFRRKRQAIMSWREGFADSRADRNPIVYVEDTTQRPHNGCRLPKRRRI